MRAFNRAERAAFATNMARTYQELNGLRRPTDHTQGKEPPGRRGAVPGPSGGLIRCARYPRRVSRKSQRLTGNMRFIAESANGPSRHRSGLSVSLSTIAILTRAS